MGRPTIAVGHFVSPEKARTGLSVGPQDNAGLVFAPVKSAGADTASPTTVRQANLVNLGRGSRDNDGVRGHSVESPWRVNALSNSRSVQQDK
jgi:hypothetical protein